jgi:hypothetical protein
VYAVVALIVVTPVLSCARGLHAHESRTLGRLRDIAEMIQEIWRHGRSIEGITSIEALRGECAQAGLNPEELFGYELDGFERSIIWQVRPGSTTHEIRVLSAGNDWTFDGGSGDDIYVRIVADGRSLKVFCRSPNVHNGREHLWQP